MDDAYLQRATSTIPKRSIVVVEDIDCAFPSRENADADDDPYGYQSSPQRQGNYSTSRGVTLSGLLNMIDGLGSEEGKLFFATVSALQLVLSLQDCNLTMPSDELY